jgi:hypothetical protein
MRSDWISRLEAASGRHAYAKLTQSSLGTDPSNLEVHCPCRCQERLSTSLSQLYALCKTIKSKNLRTSTKWPPYIVMLTLWSLPLATKVQITAWGGQGTLCARHCHRAYCLFHLLQNPWYIRWSAHSELLRNTSRKPENFQKCHPSARLFAFWDDTVT